MKKKITAIGIASHQGAGTTSILEEVSRMLQDRHKYVCTIHSRKKFNKSIRKNHANFIDDVIEKIRKDNGTDIHLIDSIEQVGEMGLLENTFGPTCVKFIGIKSVYEDRFKRLKRRLKLEGKARDWFEISRKEKVEIERSKCLEIISPDIIFQNDQNCFFATSGNVADAIHRIYNSS